MKEHSKLEGYEGWSQGLRTLLTHPYFDNLIGLLIVFNVVMIGWQADWAATHPWDDTPALFSILDTMFCIVFAIELTLRIVLYRWNFFLSKDWSWNVFDLVVVIMAISEQIIAAASNGSTANLSGIRVLRMVRLVRLMRIVRILRFF